MTIEPKRLWGVNIETIDAIQAAARDAKRWREVVPVYAAAIKAHAGELGPSSVWPTIHAVLLKRWAQSTIEKIKRAAWKVEEARRSGHESCITITVSSCAECPFEQAVSASLPVRRCTHPLVTYGERTTPHNGRPAWCGLVLKTAIVRVAP